MINIVNSIFDMPVTVSGNADVCFTGCEFAATGSNKKDTTSLGLKIIDQASANVKNSVFNSTGYSAIGVQTSGEVNIENNEFHCANNYNPIEGTVSTGSEVDKVTIKGNSFDGQCGNNYINFYKVKEGCSVLIEGNNFKEVSSDSEILRLSNPNNNHATFNVVNNNYNFDNDEVTDYTAFLMCQDYTAKSGNPQDFSKFTVNFENLVCNDKAVTKDFIAQGKLFFVYEDNKGIIEDNNPVINI